MGHFLATILSFPSVVYTVLLGASMLYWLFVLVGAVRLDAHGDGALDGLDGGHHVDAGHDAGGGHDGADGGHDGTDGGHDAEGGDSHGTALGNLMASLKLRSAPATLVLSVLSLFSWLFSVVGMQRAEAWLSPEHLPLARVALFVLAPIVALPFTSLAVRPLAGVFAPPKATGHQDLVGQVCTIRTGNVTDRFGEAMLEDGGAGIVVRVRVDPGDTLRRGDQALIVSYDEARQEFTVAPMDDGAPSPPRSRG